MKLLKALPKALKSGLLSQNPVFYCFAFLCPALAVTLSGGDSLRFGLVVLLTLTATGAARPAITRFVGEGSRLLCVAIIAGFSACLGAVLLNAFSPMHLAEPVIILPLAAVGCLALYIDSPASDRVAAGLLRGLFMGIGAVFALSLASAIRTALAFGSVFNLPVFGENYPRLAFFASPAGAFVAAGLTAGLLQFFTHLRWPSRRRPEPPPPSESENSPKQPDIIELPAQNTETGEDTPL